MPELILKIQNGGTIYHPVTEDSITWETERKGVPGRLTFTVLKDSGLNFQEGNQVSLAVDGRDVFYGFVFTKKRNKEGKISVTAYDQLRYFKNKTSTQYKNMRADEVLAMLAKDFQLDTGQLVNTGYTIPDRDEDNKTLFDILQYALDETNYVSGQMFILYDDFGKLTLRNIGDMRLDLLINKDMAEDFDYQSSIDSDTYNQILLQYDNQETGTRELYEAQSGDNINRWGLLRYYEKLNNPEDGKRKADGLLSLYNRKTRILSVSKVKGDIRARGGSLIPVSSDLGDVVANTYMVAEKVKHTLSGDTHFMDITLIGGGFNA